MRLTAVCGPWSAVRKSWVFPVQPTIAMNTRRTLVFLPLAMCLSCRDPRAEANIAQAMMDVGSAISELQQDLGDLHNQVDSLKEVAARQDTVIRQLANLAGLPLRQR